VHQIKDGKMLYINKNASVDIFAYSIGGFLSQLLLMSNPDDLFSETRLFLFCSGSVFCEMNGISRTIMDEEAFTKVKNYYQTEFKETNSCAVNSTINQKLNRAFNAMATLKNQSFRESFYEKSIHRIKLLSLKKDIVIPSLGIKNSMGNGFLTQSFREMDFPFAYSHENPFPIGTPSTNELVNKSFDDVFSQAAAFLG
jgi:hypothetical protein